jgi:8-oxo-dGTP pyrophosphatase MutT (NUDIX family)
VSVSHLFDDRLRDILSQRIPRILPPDPARRQAAVLLPIFHHAGDYHLILTKRTDTVKHHKGQVSFPGGTFEPADGDLLRTALRESQEEIGVHPQHVTVLGRLDDLPTFSTNYEFHVGDHVIWGATARIIYHFLQMTNTKTMC